jgi:predicted AAA+ superfamily ATPase
MWRRLATTRIQTLASRFPAVLILGARQVGKTTLARTAFRGVPYVDLEDPRTRALFRDDPGFQITSRANPRSSSTRRSPCPRSLRRFAG